mmetsp:Transcript_34763/g.104821  ORF Transcript_34763/g.104821 Transcript_34763/m.104821 type:complete len:360 (-) Transcript_34763:26-1105(-)
MALRRVVLISATASALVAPTARRPLQTVAQRSRSIVGAGPLEPIGEFLEQQAAPPSDAELPKGSFGAVVTGGAAGVGFAYADEFLRRGHRVVICDIKDPADAVASLKAKYGADAQIFGEVCDVSDTASVRQLAKNAKAQLKSVDYWINNAALNGGRKPFIDVSDEAIEAVVKVNMFGVLICTKVAMELMLNQVGKTGHVFNTVGSGVRGGGTPGYVTYGAAKRGLPQMTDSLVAELEGKTQGYAWPTDQPYPGKVKVHTLSPGMVFTDLLLQDSTPELRKFPFGVLAATPEEVARDLVPKILATAESGTFVEYLTRPRTLLKFFNRFVRQIKSDIIDDDGNVIRKDGETYNEDGVRALY